MDKRYWIVLYDDGTYQELSCTKEQAKDFADQRQIYRGGGYRLVEWKD